MPSQNPRSNRFRVLILEDSAPMQRILANEFELLGWVEDGRKVLETALQTKPDAIVLDISLPGVIGMILLPQLRQCLPSAAIVMLTNHNSQDYIERAYRDGADGYVLKSDAHEALISAITRASVAHPSFATVAQAL